MSDISNPIHPKHGCPVPLTLKCTVSGKIVKYTAVEYIKGKIAEAGSLEKLLATYVSKGAHKHVAEQSSTSVTKQAAPKKEESTTQVKTSRSWKGENLMGSPKDPKGNTPTPPTTPTDDPTVEVVFILGDGTECTVTSPRSMTSQSIEDKDVIDFRSKHKNIAQQD